MTGIVLFAHGSRIEPANDAVRSLAAELARSGSCEHVEAAFLELGEPNLETAVARLAGRGVRRVVVIPYFLTLGLHLERDLPALLRRISLNNKGLEISATAPLDGHPALLQALIDRARTVVD